MFSKNQSVRWVVVLATWVAIVLHGGQNNGAFVSANRPDKMTDPSCTPGKDTQCIAGTKCVPVPAALDAGGKPIGGAKAKSGVCMCDSFYGSYRRLPTPDSPETFGPDGFAHDDLCAKNVTMQVVYTLWSLMLVALNVVLLTDIITTIVRLKKSNALKFNVAGRSLVICAFHNLFELTLSMVYMMLHLSWDKGYWFHDNIRSSVLSFAALTTNLVHLEVLVAWIDLVQKAATLSRTSNKILIAIQWFLRIFVVAACLVYVYFFFSGVDLGSLVVLLALVTLIAIQIAGRVLRRTLCPNLNDKTHANYKAAEAIRFFYTFLGTWEPLNYFFVLLRPILLTGRDYGALAFLVQPVNFVLPGSIFTASWITYLKFGNKKVLAPYPESWPEKVFGAIGLGALDFTEVDAEIENEKK
jgi:ABC-type multidrug transport system fused ATPase/permease subunit